MSDKRAYYIEYPDKEMAVMIQHDEGQEPKILTADHLAPEVFIAGLMVDGYETFAYTRKSPANWEHIDPAELENVALMEDNGAKRHQLHNGEVICATDGAGPGKSYWPPGSPLAGKHGVELVPQPDGQCEKCAKYSAA